MSQLDPFAAYGAVVATAVALWNVRESWRTRALRVSAYIGTVYIPTGIVGRE
jgi:hypothetical protein